MLWIGLSVNLWCSVFFQAIYADCEKEKNDIITFEDFKKGIRIVSFKK